MKKRELRKLRGELICHRPGKKIIGEDKGKKIMKSIRKKVLNDVQKIWNQEIAVMKKRIDEELGDKYHYDKKNPFWDWYLKYIIECKAKPKQIKLL